MVANLFKGLFVGASLVLASSAIADYDFSPADQKYFQRANGSQAIGQAVAEYEAALKSSLTKEEKVYAVEQLARLHSFEASIQNPDNTKGIMTNAEKCLNKVALLEPGKNNAPTPEYYYWHAACRMVWAKAKGVLTALSYAKQISQLITAGSNLDSTYEGGGFDRLSGALYSNLPSINPMGAPHGDLSRALNDFQNSLNSDTAYTHPLGIDWVDPSTETGEYFYLTNVYYAQALAKNGEDDAAIDILDTAIKAIEANHVPKGREAETVIALKMLKRQRASL